MTELHLVRHGKAGRRDQWDGPDDLRPLSNTGQRQAAAIKKVLAAGKTSTDPKGVKDMLTLELRPL